MKLSLKQKALLQALAIIAASIVAGTVFAFVLSNIPPAMAPYIVLAGVIIVGVRYLYKLILSQLEYEEEWKERKKKG
jgi:CHASE2 domain-containing sensor protein